MLKFKPLTFCCSKKIITIIDQTRLPGKEYYIDLKTVDDVFDAIKTMKLRGAPLIGVAAAYGLVLAARKNKIDSIVAAADYLGSARPTAINLTWAIKRMIDIAHRSQNLYEELLTEAQAIEKEDRDACKEIGKYGSSLLKQNAKCMVYCNAGALATSGIGTALGIIYTAKSQHKDPIIYACETRPLLQGARLTSWELTKNDIETFVICDNMAATYLPEMDLVLVGADRIASNGDTANKIGTHGLAVIARYHNIDFYVAAPLSTFDFNLDKGSDIPIEMRAEEEISNFNGTSILAHQTKVCNPAFDVTPAHLITGIITEKGIIKKPDRDKIQKTINSISNKNRRSQAGSQ
jgi:methylthioribose-1-phosphate isomerase